MSIFICHIFICSERKNKFARSQRLPGKWHRRGGTVDMDNGIKKYYSDKEQCKCVCLCVQYIFFFSLPIQLPPCLHDKAYNLGLAILVFCSRSPFRTDLPFAALHIIICHDVFCVSSLTDCLCVRWTPFTLKHFSGVLTLEIAPENNLPCRSPKTPYTLK